MSTALAACGGSIINMGCGADDSGDGTGGGSGDGAINPGATEGAYNNNGTISADCSQSQNDIYWQPVEGATTYRLSRDGNLIYEGTATNHTDSEATGDHAYLLESVLADGTIKNEILSVNQADCIAQTQFEGGDANGDGLSIQVQCLDAENLQILWDYTGEFDVSYQLIITDSIDGELVNEPQISPYTLTNLLGTSLSAGGQLTIAVEALDNGVDVVATESVIVTEDCTSAINLLGITCDPTTIYLEYQAISVTDPVTVALIGDVATVDEDLGVVDGINTVTFNRVDFESPNNVVNIVFTDSGSGAIITQQLDVNLTQTCDDNPVDGTYSGCGDGATTVASTVSVTNTLPGGGSNSYNVNAVVVEGVGTFEVTPDGFTANSKVRSYVYRASTQTNNTVSLSDGNTLTITLAAGDALVIRNSASTGNFGVGFDLTANPPFSVDICQQMAT